MNLNAGTKTVAENDVITTLKNIAETGVYRDEDVKALIPGA